VRLGEQLHAPRDRADIRRDLRDLRFCVLGPRIGVIDFVGTTLGLRQHLLLQLFLQNRTNIFPLALSAPFAGGTIEIYLIK
jgi:hypothetical protein